ncbi:RhoGAP-domain-containing protein [Rhizophagus irregularis]|uniref:RhoGAP-domain-containing protein n=1 Tax=Rhizophagus irregularis TaxID=588596 RepID=A0A2I1GVA7_9GLOM|nr:RhoGAP-domain-containing protein [Rhizophagus irregularis]
MADRSEVVPEEANTTKQNFTTCAKCGLLIVGQFVRALGGTYHLDCFKCQCGTIVAAKFFPIEGPDGKQYPLCERDYFRRLNLICEKCGGALRGSYITALDKKYHIEHFTCSACPTVFGPQDSYYEHDGQVYCHYHYSTRFAVKCAGCQTAILKQFVEINRNSIDEHWHPECYMIHKFWNVKLSNHPDDKQGLENEQEATSPEELKNKQKAKEEKVYNIWTVLSTFEEMSAACISDMLLHVSNGSYFDGVRMAEKFISHVEILFSAIDDLEKQLVQTSGQGLQHNREAKMLCKKIVNFFSLLSHSKETDVRQMGITQELLSLVTGLAHYLKVLIRIALTGALKLERDFDHTRAIGQFLGKLVELTKKGSQLDKDTNIDSDSEVTSDLCHACRITVEEECYKYGQYRWHIGCLRCSGCSRELRTIYKDASFNQITEMAFCPNDTNEQSALGFQYVTQLEQYTYLLRVALSRLYNLLRRKDEGQSQSDIEVERGRKEQKSEPGLIRKDSRSKSYSSGDSYEARNRTDIKRMKSVHMDTKLSNSARFATRSRIIEQESEPTTSSVPNEKDKLARAPSQHHVRIVQDQAYESQSQENMIKFDSQNEAITLADISAIAAAEMEKNVPEDKSNKTSRRKSRSKCYLSELSALEYFIVKHVAVLAMEQLLKEHFTLEELLDLIGSKKATLWTKFVTSIKPTEKKPIKKKGTFGVPLEVLVERYGIDSVLSAGPGRIRIPSFVDDSISAMKTMDMSVEGIFRKNGNIRRLKDLSEAIDKNPSAVNLSEDNPVQVAALMKKFLRDLPDPLLTFKLHRLFITSQKLVNEADRKKILHLTCCLLPKINRDTMEVLFIFFKWVASFSHVDEETGSKMDLHNLATVITPNILYSKSKDPTKDDSFLAIEAVHSLLNYQDDFWVVPEDLAAILHDQDLFSNPEGLTTKDILRRCEKFVSSKKDNSNNNGEGPSSGNGEVQVVRHNNPQHQTYIEQGNSENQNPNSTNIYPASSSSSSSIVNNENSIPVEQRAS